MTWNCSARRVGSPWINYCGVDHLRLDGYFYPREYSVGGKSTSLYLMVSSCDFWKLSLKSWSLIYEFLTMRSVMRLLEVVPCGGFSLRRLKPCLSGSFLGTRDFLRSEG